MILKNYNNGYTNKELHIALLQLISINPAYEKYLRDL